MKFWVSLLNIIFVEYSILNLRDHELIRNTEDLRLVSFNEVSTNRKYVQVSISSTFYACIFCMKVLCAAFLYLRFGFRIFGTKIVYQKCERKMFMKLTTEDLCHN